MNLALRILLILVGVIAALVITGAIGVAVKPAPFAPFPQKGEQPETIPVPTGLPAPVQRFYATVYGERMPVIKNVVFSGSVRLRPNIPFYMNGRFRFTHIVGQSYRHYIEATIFGFPLLKVNERYLNGVSKFDIPMIGTEENQPNTNQGANLGMWSELAWIPSAYLTDPRVKWEPVDDTTALLKVPYGDQTETYVARFDPASGLLTWMEVMRYHAATSTEKTLWMNQSLEWVTVNGRPFPKTGAAIWMDDGKPWAYFTIEEVVYNAYLDQYISATGE